LSAEGTSPTGPDGVEPLDDADVPAADDDVVDVAVDTHGVSEDEHSVDEAPAVGIFSKTKYFVESNPMAGYPLLGMAGFLGITFAIAIVKTAAKGFTKEGKRTKTVNKNKLVIDELSKFLPDNREGLKGSAIAGVRLRTGFTPTEIFRKYLWFMLRERKFDPECIADLVELRGALNLTNEEVASALKERAERVYKQYGTVMLDTSGLSQAGIERKATSRALFSKMMYLVECEDLLGVDFDRKQAVDLREIFGCTEEDCSRLRIASLYEVDLENLIQAEGTISSPEETEQ
jgi:hypothetical protein